MNIINNATDDYSYSNREDDNVQKITVGIIGVIFLIISILMIVKDNDLVKKCILEAEATIIGMDEELSSDTDNVKTYIYYPIIEYKTKTSTVQTRIDKASSIPEYKIGQKITILYNPNKKSEFIIKGDITSSIMSYILMCIGILLIIYSIFTTLKDIRKLS